MQLVPLFSSFQWLIIRSAHSSFKFVKVYFIICRNRTLVWVSSRFGDVANVALPFTGNSLSCIRIKPCCMSVEGEVKYCSLIVVFSSYDIVNISLYLFSTTFISFVTNLDYLICVSSHILSKLIIISISSQSSGQLVLELLVLVP